MRKYIYKMVLVSDILDHIGRIYNPLNLANMKIQKLKFVRNTAPDNHRVLNFLRSPDVTGAYFCYGYSLPFFILFIASCIIFMSQSPEMGFGSIEFVLLYSSYCTLCMLLGTHLIGVIYHLNTQRMNPQ